MGKGVDQSDGVKLKELCKGKVGTGKSSFLPAEKGNFSSLQGKRENKGIFSEFCPSCIYSFILKCLSITSNVSGIVPVSGRHKNEQRSCFHEVYFGEKKR